MGSSQSKSYRLPKKSTPPSPFLDWDEQQPGSYRDYASIFQSLIQTLKEDCVLDDEKQLKAVKFLHFLPKLASFLDSYLPDYLFPHDEDKELAFMDYMLILLGCPSWTVATRGLQLLASWVHRDSSDVMFSIIKEGRITQLMLLIQPQTRSLEANEDFHNSLVSILNLAMKCGIPSEIIRLIKRGVQESAPAIRDTLLNNLIIPSSYYVEHLLRHMIRTQSQIRMFDVYNLTIALFDSAIRHQPTMHFLRSSSVPQAFVLFVSEVGDEYAVSNILKRLSSFPFLIDVGRGDIRERTQDVMRMLQDEGLEDAIEQKLMNVEKQRVFNNIRQNSLRVCILSGSNGSFSRETLHNPE